MVFQTPTKTQNVAQRGIENNRSEKPRAAAKNAKTPRSSIPEMRGRVEQGSGNLEPRNLSQRQIVWEGIGLRIEAAAASFLNSHASKYACLYPSTWAVLNRGQGSCFSQRAVVNVTC